MKTSIIVSIYNEENGIKKFLETIISKIKQIQTKENTFELLLVNDGSTDNTKSILEDEIKKIENDKNLNCIEVKLINFSRNFGHEAAMIAGLDNASGDKFIFMDSDLQHPIEKISDIINNLNSGNDIVLMVRSKNKGAGFLKNITSKAFYYLINKLSNTHFEINASDYFAFNENVANVLKNNYREKVRFLRGFVQNIGFNKSIIEYEAGERAGGKSHYDFMKLFNLSINSIMSFSNFPLKLGTFFGVLSGLLGLILLVYTLVTRKGAPSGYATIVILLCFMFAVLFFIIGVIGEYIGILFIETKERPIYIIKDIKESKK